VAHLVAAHITIHIVAPADPYCLRDAAELPMGRVDPWVGLGRDFSVFGGLSWVESTTAKILKI